MKLELYKGNERGITELDWLKSHHSFSFNHYNNPERNGFGALRVLNDDTVAPGQGFGAHPHRDMEIVTIVLAGALEHADSMGHVEVIPAGDIQRMSAGKGIYHSEYNHSEKDPVHFLQVWVQTKERGITPSYEQRTFPSGDRKNKLVRVVSGHKGNGSVYIHQDGSFYLGNLEKGVTVTHNMENPQAGVFVFVINGEIEIGGKRLKTADGAGITEADKIDIKANLNSEVLVIEVPYPWKN